MEVKCQMLFLNRQACGASAYSSDPSIAEITAGSLQCASSCCFTWEADISVLGALPFRHFGRMYEATVSSTECECSHTWDARPPIADMSGYTSISYAQVFGEAQERLLRILAHRMLYIAEKVDLLAHTISRRHILEGSACQ